MIELGTSERYLAIYQHEVTGDTFQCALDLTYGDLRAWYEPVYFGREDVLRFVQETSGLIDGRRTIARLEAAQPTAPGIEMILTPRAGSADYHLGLTMEQERAGMLLEAEHVAVAFDVPHTSLLTAFRTLYQMLPDALDMPVRPQLIDLGGIESGGCLIHYRWRGRAQPPEDDIVRCLVDVQLEEITASHCAQSFFASDLERFASEVESVAQGGAESASLRGLDQRFHLELVTHGLRHEWWARIEMRALVLGSSWMHEETVGGGYTVSASVMNEAARTIRELLHAEGLLEGQQ